VLALPWAWLGLFLLVPAAIVLKISLAAPADAVPPYSALLRWGGAWLPRVALHLDSYALILGDPLYLRALLLSVKVAGIATLVCLLAGYPMALAIAQAPERYRNALLLAVILPFWTGLLQDDGWVNSALVALGLGAHRLLYTDTAMYLGIVYTYLPFMVLPLYARLTRQDPTLLEAAADLGAAPWSAFWRVTFPLSLPGVWAGVLLVFIPAVGEYVIPELLGGPQAQLVGRVLWEEFFANRDWPMASALAVALLVLLLIVPGGIWRLAGRHLARRHLAQQYLSRRGV
jgi:putrescine transport system permease protein